MHDDPIAFCLERAKEARRKANEPTPLQSFYTAWEAEWLIQANRFDLARQFQLPSLPGRDGTTATGPLWVR